MSPIQEAFVMNVGAGLIAGLILLVLAAVRDRLALSLSRRHPRFAGLTFWILILTWLLTTLGLIGLFYEGSLYSELIGLVLPTLALGYLLVQESGRLRRVGIRGADSTIQGGVDYPRALHLCRNTLSFLGTGAAKLTNQHDFEATLARLREDQVTRFLLMRPDAEALTRAAMRAGRDRDEYARLVKESLRRIADIRTRRSLNLAVRFYSSEPVFRLFFIDHSICLVSFNVFGEGDGSQLPQLYVIAAGSHQPSSRSFYFAFERYFEILWESAAPWDFQEYLG